jgi:O-antigen biosynthesis protein
MSTTTTDHDVPLATARDFAPAIFVRTPRTGGLDPEWLEGLRRQFPGSRLLARPRLARTAGLEALDCHTGSAAAIASAMSPDDWPDGLLVIRPGLVLPGHFRARLARMVLRPGLPALTLFAGNHDKRLNPLAELDPCIEGGAADSLVFNCAERRWTAVAEAGSECFFLASPQQIKAVGSGAGASRSALIDEFYLFDPTRPLNAGRAPIAAERAALGHLRRALVALELEGVQRLPLPGLDGKEVVLHITHSWGGGIARWIGDQWRHDDQAHHLVLASAGHRDGTEHGQQLLLCACGPDRGRIQELVLTPPISDSCNSHSAYREFLAWLLDRFRVGRIVVSSLIGHSLDCLKTGLPTLQVLHDFYPASPVLDVDPLNYLDAAGRFRMKENLEENRANLRFEFHDPAYWRELREHWLAAVTGHEVVLVAPSEHVAMRWQRLFRDQLGEISIVHHGFRTDWEDLDRIQPRKRLDGRLNLVMVGRLSSGKGLGLLDAALERLSEHAHVTLIGAGQQAERFFGRPGVDVILEFSQDDLPGQLATVGPEAALFLSTVPETWSYVLSELRSLGIVPIATRTGAFVERIRDGKDGLLFDPTPEALVELIAGLADDRGPLEQLTALGVSDPDLASAFERYRELAGSGREPVAAQLPERAFLPQRAWALAEMTDLGVAIDQAEARLVELEEELARRSDWAQRQQRLVAERTAWARRLEAELDDRTRWAQTLEQDLAVARERHRTLLEELDDRTQWARSLEQDLACLRADHQALQDELEDRTRWARQLDGELENLRKSHAALQATLDQREVELARIRQDFASLELARRRLDELSNRQRASLADLEARHHALEQHLAIVLNSLSWRMTRPVRFVTRSLRKLMSRRAWNPLTWPRLIRTVWLSLAERGLRQSLVHWHHQPLHGVQECAGPDSDAEPDPQALPDEAPDLDRSSDVTPAGVVVPTSPRPLASIVIPVYNKVELTRACLDSIAHTPVETPFEVIVVDDCSSDRTADFLTECSGISALRNEANSGFIDTCNRGAEAARGEFVVFLNNDTTVTSGWLDALIQPFRADDGVGVVGAKLVYPDGRLQEFGGIIFNDASGWNYGRGDAPDLPQYNFVSEADYVSGACLAVRHGDFIDLGGFDTRFRPAYYEDTDLCFQVRARGKKVIVQPAAIVIHHEGATSGTDESSGVKQYQVVNRKKFSDKWAQILADHPPPEPDFQRQDPIRHARYRRFRRRMLLIDATTPQPDHDSGSVRIVAMMTLLREMGYQVSFMPENRLWVERYSSALQQAGIEVLCAPQVSELEAWLSEHGTDLDLVVVSRHYVLTPIISMIRQYCSRALLAFDTVDLHFLREEREAEVTGSESIAEQARATRQQELSLVKSADTTLVVSPVERELLAELVPGADVRIVSNIHEVMGSSRGWEDRHGLMFVGGFQHLPNVDAARWLVAEIFPRVRAAIPDVELHLIGSRMPSEILSIDAPGVRVHGFVEALGPFLDGCRVSVAPLRYGAGVKGKVNQAMSHGLPVVATTCAAEGMFLENGKDVLVADLAEDFAEQVIRVHQDRELWKRLSHGGLANVEQYFSRSAARRALEGIDQLVKS